MSASLAAFERPRIGSSNAVYLIDWWLIKAEPGTGGNQLGVGGFTCKQRQDGRLFHSTAIAKRHDTITLQTVDDTTILVSGLINRSRTLQNGFSYEVCNQFHFGFPYNWEEFAALAFGESTNEDAAFRISGFKESVKTSADDTSSSCSMYVDHLPAHLLRDLLVSSVGHPEGGMLRKNILGEILHKYSSNAFASEASCLNRKSGNQVTNEDLSLDETPCQKKKATTNLGKEYETHLHNVQCTKKVFLKSNHKSGAGIDTNRLSGGRFKRGKASLYKNIMVNQEQEERDVLNAESGQGVNDSSTNGPLTRSKARKFSISRRK